MAFEPSPLTPFSASQESSRSPEGQQLNNRGANKSEFQVPQGCCRQAGAKQIIGERVENDDYETLCRQPRVRNFKQ